MHETGRRLLETLSASRSISFRSRDDTTGTGGPVLLPAAPPDEVPDLPRMLANRASVSSCQRPLPSVLGSFGSLGAIASAKWSVHTEYNAQMKRTTIFASLTSQACGGMLIGRECGQVAEGTVLSACKGTRAQKRLAFYL